jgi:hypothetical protein
MSFYEEISEYTNNNATHKQNKAGKIIRSGETSPEEIRADIGVLEYIGAFDLP